MSGRIASELADIVGPSHVLTDPALQRAYVADWTGRWVGATPAVVRPATTGEVSAVLVCCAARGRPVVPQGGNTGLVGGGVPLEGEVVVSLERARGIGPVDTIGRTVRAGAGVTLRELGAAVAEDGFVYGVDFAARDRATIGGTVATNAGGHQVLRYGMTRHQLRGLEVVLADGTVLTDLVGLAKDNTGYALDQLLCGSEGTLGIVTEAVLALHPRPIHRVAALVGFASRAAAIDAAGVARSVPTIDALELLLAPGVALVCEEFALPPPLPAGVEAMLLIELAGMREQEDDAVSLMASMTGVTASALGLDGPARARLWRYRELHTEAIGRLGVPHKLDIAVPPGSVLEVLAAVESLVARLRPDARVFCFGHLGDGNVHVNVTGVSPGDQELDDAVLALVARHGGTISAEHGIGRARRQHLGLRRGEGEIAAYRRIKQALDPAGICNPGVLLDDGPH